MTPELKELLNDALELLEENGSRLEYRSGGCCEIGVCIGCGCRTDVREEQVIHSKNCAWSRVVTELRKVVNEEIEDVRYVGLPKEQMICPNCHKETGWYHHCSPNNCHLAVQVEKKI